MAESILRLQSVKKSYGTVVKTTVLHGIDLEFPPESFNAIIGQSGSGKSTLLNIIGTLDVPDEGAVYINERRVDTLKPKELSRVRNRTLGFIFQYHYLLPEFTAFENILIPYRMHHKHIDKETLAYANELVAYVGLEAVKNNRAMEMSGGQQQRTAIARALINRPSIILADEPTGSLDSDSSEAVYALLRRINKELKTTFILITHDKKIAERADRMIEISDGRIVMDVDMLA